MKPIIFDHVNKRVVKVGIDPVGDKLWRDLLAASAQVMTG